ncbi:reverse transcriptase domain-containing protein [Tanacetum coccineum]
MELKTKLEATTKNHQPSILNLEAKFDRLADRQFARSSRSLPSNTLPNPRGNLPKLYTPPPQARNEHVNVVFTRSGRSYDPPTNPNNSQDQNNKTFSCNALADLDASINLMSYSLYAKLSLEALKPTKMSVRLADRSFQYLIGIAENMLVEVGKFTFPVDFVILEMEEDRTPLEDKIFFEFDEFIAMNIEENIEPEIDKEETPFEKITFDTDYKIKKSLDEPPMDLELKPLPNHLEYAFLEEPSFLPMIISSQLSEQN